MKELVCQYLFQKKYKKAQKNRLSGLFEPF
jgi:hypothetical protein